MGSISYCFRRCSRSLLNPTTGGSPSMAAIRLFPPNWNATLLLLPCNSIHQRQQTLLLRSLSSTTTKSDDIKINVDALTKKQKNVYVCKSIYRQMLRWCQNYHHHRYPPDLLQYFTKIPKHYTLVPHLFPAHDYIYQKFTQLQNMNQPEKSDASGCHPPTSATTASMEKIYTFLKQIPILQSNTHKNKSKILVFNIQSILDVQNCIRALYRLNIRHTPSDNPTITKNEQEVEKFEKLCRNLAFEEVKHMNEISVELQICQQQRHIRHHHEFNALQSYYNDCTIRNYDPSDRILPIGQVVQHKEDRWRGIIVHWSYDSGKQDRTKRLSTFPNKKTLSTKVRDDFTSLTLKSYAAAIENKDDIDKLDGPSGSQSANSSNESQYLASSIVYEIALDTTYRQFFDEDHDDGDPSGSESDTSSSSTSSSSQILKRQLLHTNQTSIPTFITVRQPLLPPPPRDNTSFGDVKSNLETGATPSLSSPSPSILEVVHDEYLCRIRNPIIRRIFTKYDFRTKSYIPNTYMNYTYPNWYPTKDFGSESNTATTSTLFPNNNDKSENDDVDISDHNVSKIMSDMLQQIKGFALHLVTVIDNAIGNESQKDNRSNSTSKKENENNHINRLEDTISDLRNDLYGMAVLDPTSAHLLFNALPLSKQVSFQLRGMEYVSMTVFEAMYKRRRNKATVSATNQYSIDTLPYTQQEDVGDSTEERFQFTPKFHLGQIVRHKKYHFRGVIVGRDSEPIYNVSRWDGLRDIPNAKELPFYNVIPDQQDCIEIFGGERPARYVCEVNLEPCPPDQMYLDVDVDVGWTKSSDGSYRPLPFQRFKYGYDNDDLDTSDASNDYDAFEKCLMAVESEINQWHCECVRNKLLHPELSTNDNIDTTSTTDVSSSGVQQYAISIHDLIKLLQVADNVDDAASIRESIKLFGKAHPNIQLRTQLQYGIDLMVADNCEKARTILRSIVTEDDPTYIEAWNYLANSENFLSLQKEAFVSAKKVLDLNKNDFQAYTQLGILHFQQGEYGKAEVNFKKSLALDPWSIVASKLSECIDLINDKDDDMEYR